MTRDGTSWAALRDLLTDRYDDLRARLTRWLGSEDLAAESLHETWLRLSRDDHPGEVRSPTGFLIRTAVNIAADKRRAERRRARRADVREALDVADPQPDPAQAVEARLALDLLHAAIAELPPRTRDILIAARLHGRQQDDIARQFGISARMVRIELRRALDHCEARMRTPGEGDFRSPPLETSVGKGRSAQRTAGARSHDESER